jgi:hypothetical protein
MARDVSGHPRTSHRVSSPVLSPVEGRGGREGRGRKACDPSTGSTPLTAGKLLSTALEAGQAEATVEEVHPACLGVVLPKAGAAIREGPTCRGVALHGQSEDGRSVTRQARSWRPMQQIAGEKCGAPPPSLTAP